MKLPKNICVVSVIDTIDVESFIVPVKLRLGVEELATMIMNFEGYDNDEYDEMVSVAPYFKSGKIDYNIKWWKLCSSENCSESPPNL